MKVVVVGISNCLELLQNINYLKIQESEVLTLTSPLINVNNPFSEYPKECFKNNYKSSGYGCFVNRKNFYARKRG